MNPDKKEKQHRHTIPNSNYPSFPSSFYQEEIELKTSNLIDDNNNNITVVRMPFWFDKLINLTQIATTTMNITDQPLNQTLNL